jgi:Cdc6-like AAA superfamily ATPase
MKLKEFVDKGGVVTLNNAGDLQEVVRYAEKVGYPVAKQYTCSGNYPFFFRVQDGVVLTKEGVKDNGLIISTKEFSSNVEMILQEVKENKGEVVYVKCNSDSEMKFCYDYFTKTTGQKGWSGGYMTPMPYFNLQNGYPYPSYCLEKGSMVISFEDFQRTFQPASNKKNLVMVLDKIDSIMKGMYELKKMIEKEAR